MSPIPVIALIGDELIQHIEINIDLWYVSDMIYLLLLLDIILTVSAQLVLRVGAKQLTGGLSLALLFEPLKNIFLFAGMALFATSFFLYVFILSKLQLNVVYPVATGVVLVLITALSHFFLKETLTALQAVGIAAILIGVVLVLLPR